MKHDRLPSDRFNVTTASIHSLSSWSSDRMLDFTTQNIHWAIVIVVEHIQILRKDCGTRAHTHSERMCVVWILFVAVFAEKKTALASECKKPQQQQQQRQRDVHFRSVCVCVCEYKSTTVQHFYETLTGKQTQNAQAKCTRVRQRWEMCEIALWKRHAHTTVTSMATAAAAAATAAAPPEKYAIRSIFSHHQVCCAIS